LKLSKNKLKKLRKKRAKRKRYAKSTEHLQAHLFAVGLGYRTTRFGA